MALRLILVLVYFNCVFCNNSCEDAAVYTSAGLFKGNTLRVFNQTISEYLGIPYAVPPLGSLRFAKPKPIVFEKGIIDATKPKHSCIQNTENAIIENLTISEDCLTINIWSPKVDTKLKPVMVWIYGGGLSAGSIYQPEYNGSVLATNDIVFVSINYRLGQLGFLYGGEDSAPGNVGFFDQLLALKWVRENIHLFGGEKNQITIFGESAGSWSVSAHIISPLSKGLFKRAIMQSAANMFSKDRPIVSKDDSISNAKALAKRVNCTDDKQWLDCLRKVDAKQFTPDASSLTFPVEGTEFLPLNAQKAFSELKFYKDMDLMVGVTKDEGSLLSALFLPEVLTRKNLTKEDFIKFVNISKSLYFHDLNVENITDFYLNNVNTSDSNAIKLKIWEFLGDVIAKCPTYLFAKRYAEHSSPETNVYFYELTHIMKQKIPGLDLGVYHSADIDFVFGLSLVEPNTTSDENIRFTEEVMKYWTNFAKYGKPDNNWSKLIDTKSHSSVTQTKELNPKVSNKYLNNLFDETCDGFWKHYF